MRLLLIALVATAFAVPAAAAVMLLAGDGAELITTTVISF